MLKIHGIPVSNYYNIVKHSLLEKGLEFDEVHVAPNQEADYLALSPMGKVPCLQTDSGCLSETSAILDYIEDTYPNPPLAPADAFQRAKTKELMRVAELYIELPARRHLNEVIFGGDRNQTAFDEAKPLVQRGLNAVKQLASFDPYVSGEQFGYSDIYLFHVFGLASHLMEGVYDWNIVAEVPGLGANLDVVGTRETSQTVVSDQQVAMKALLGK